MNILINTAITITTIISNKEIHIGLNTHTQDQFITPINFNTMNAIVSNPQNPTPLL